MNDETVHLLLGNGKFENLIGFISMNSFYAPWKGKQVRCTIRRIETNRII